MQVIILGAGKPHFGKKASAIINIIKNQKTLDFILDVAEKHASSIKFISGFNHKEIKKKFLNINIKYNKYWNKSGPIYSLSQTNINENEDLIIMYSDILIRKKFFEKIINSNSDLTISCDSLYFKRFENRNIQDLKRVEKVIFFKNKKLNFVNNILPKRKSAELLGLIKINKKHIPLLKKYLLKANNRVNNLKLIHLLNYFNNLKLNSKNN